MTYAEYTQRWNFKKADWTEFKNKCKSELTSAGFQYENTNNMKLFTTKLYDLSESTIPKTSTVSKKLYKPWWNEEYQEACTNKKKSAKIVQTTTN